ncbi:MAG: DegV family protein [Chloroflexi bacterium]|nr:DegV family protein [Chloroflexota bacterium]
MRPVRVLTDSASDLDPTEGESLGCTVIPVPVYLGNEVFEDRVSLRPDEFFLRLRQTNILPKTSQPSPAVIAATLQRLLDEGYDIVSIIMSSKMSTTIESVRRISERIAPKHIRVVDSCQISLGEQIVVRAVTQFAQRGAALADVVAYAEQVKRQANIYGVLQTLEYLQKSGRIGRVASVVGGLLSLKVLVNVEDGLLAPLDRVRTWLRALERLKELIVARSPFEGPLIVGHAANFTDAIAIKEALGEAFPHQEVLLQQIGPAIGTHSGPGAIGVAFLEASQVGNGQ